VSAPVLSLSELDTPIGRFITVDYHRRTHQETGQPPIERWLNSGWWPRMPESLELLDLLLLTVATPRKMHRDGIRCHGLRYLDLTLAAYVGEQVTARLRPAGPGRDPGVS
jgi:putative transposase